MSEPTPVYVVTDLGQPAEPHRQADPYALLRAALKPLLGLAAVAVPVLATTALLAGLLLGWRPIILAAAALLALPILINLADLLGARLGWPPLAWVAARITRRPPASSTTEETSPDA